MGNAWSHRRQYMPRPQVCQTPKPPTPPPPVAELTHFNIDGIFDYLMGPTARFPGGQDASGTDIGGGVYIVTVPTDEGDTATITITATGDGSDVTATLSVPTTPGPITAAANFGPWDGTPGHHFSGTFGGTGSTGGSAAASFDL